MRNLFNLDSPIMRGLSRVFDLFVLNIVFIVSCIPVITIGAACTSMHYVCLKIARGEDPYIFKSYIKAFKENFKQATLLWLIIMGVFGILILDLMVLRTTQGAFMEILRTVILILTVYAYIVQLYIFPTIARFQCTKKEAVKNAFIFSIVHLPKTILLTIVNGIPIILAFISPEAFSLLVFMLPLIGCAIIFYLSSFIINSVFKKYEPEKEDDTDEYKTLSWM